MDVEVNTLFAGEDGAVRTPKSIADRFKMSSIFVKTTAVLGALSLVGGVLVAVVGVILMTTKASVDVKKDDLVKEFSQALQAYKRYDIYQLSPAYFYPQQSTFSLNSETRRTNISSTQYFTSDVLVSKSGPYSPPSYAAISVNSQVIYISLPQFTKIINQEMQCDDSTGCTWYQMNRRCTGNYTGTGCSQAGACGSCEYVGFRSQVCVVLQEDPTYTLPTTSSATTTLPYTSPSPTPPPNTTQPPSTSPNSPSPSSQTTTQPFTSTSSASNVTTPNFTTSPNSTVTVSFAIQSSQRFRLDPSYESCDYPFALESNPLFDSGDGFEMKIMIRTSSDPYLAFQRLTKGTGSFDSAAAIDVEGDSSLSTTLLWIGAIAFGVGVLLFIAVFLTLKSGSQTTCDDGPLASKLRSIPQIQYLPPPGYVIYYLPPQSTQSSKPTH